MTPLPALDAATLPPIDRAALPQAVREGDAEDRRLYRAALGFERLLLNELLEGMTASAQAPDEETDAAGEAYRSLVPQTLADALVARGGVGLAPELWRTLREGGAAA